jgi:hypothetical protein
MIKVSDDAEEDDDKVENEFAKPNLISNLVGKDRCMPAESKISEEQEKLANYNQELRAMAIIESNMQKLIRKNSNINLTPEHRMSLYNSMLARLRSMMPEKPDASKPNQVSNSDNNAMQPQADVKTEIEEAQLNDVKLENEIQDMKPAEFVGKEEAAEQPKIHLTTAAQKSIEAVLQHINPKYASKTEALLRACLDASPNYKINSKNLMLSVDGNSILKSDISRSLDFICSNRKGKGPVGTCEILVGFKNAGIETCKIPNKNIHNLYKSLDVSKIQTGKGAHKIFAPSHYIKKCKPHVVMYMY